MANKYKYYKFNECLRRPTFIDGVSKLADFSSLKLRYIEMFGEDADYHALLSDWLTIGDDFHKAYNDLARETTENV